MNNPTLSPQAARGLSALISDIITIDTRAKCSDRFFRRHFMLIVRTLVQTGVLKELEAALQDSPMDSAQQAEARPPEASKSRRGKPKDHEVPQDEQAAE